MSNLTKIGYKKSSPQKGVQPKEGTPTIKNKIYRIVIDNVRHKYERTHPSFYTLEFKIYRHT